MVAEVQMRSPIPIRAKQGATRVRLYIRMEQEIIDKVERIKNAMMMISRVLWGLSHIMRAAQVCM